ncbi:hypothetical protein B0A52_03191 [Exophiala mesophila]|uniref:Uncharacterized protein n=1 Tax=Exophiala mesophila TaxID=212818 RepID=A0A438NAN7_EXOME|nr:hypothetical protein B0A52_03191 [Exophiala mesophila]
MDVLMCYDPNGQWTTHRAPRQSIPFWLYLHLLREMATGGGNVSRWQRLRHRAQQQFGDDLEIPDEVLQGIHDVVIFLSFADRARLLALPEALFRPAESESESDSEAESQKADGDDANDTDVLNENPPNSGTQFPATPTPGPHGTKRPLSISDDDEDQAQRKRARTGVESTNNVSQGANLPGNRLSDPISISESPSDDGDSDDGLERQASLPLHQSIEEDQPAPEGAASQRRNSPAERSAQSTQEPLVEQDSSSELSSLPGEGDPAESADESDGESESPDQPERQRTRTRTPEQQPERQLSRPPTPGQPTFWRKNPGMLMYSTPEEAAEARRRQAWQTESYNLARRSPPRATPPLEYRRGKSPSHFDPRVIGEAAAAANTTARGRGRGRGRGRARGTGTGTRGGGATRGATGGRGARGGRGRGRGGRGRGSSTTRAADEARNTDADPDTPSAQEAQQLARDERARRRAEWRGRD